MKTSYIIIAVVVVVILFIIFYIKECINEKKGINSKEKQEIRNIIMKLVPDAEQFTTAYAIWQDIQISGGGRRITTTTHYKYYAVAFQSGIIYIVPLFFDGGSISYGNPQCLTKENLGMVNAKAGDSWATFYDLDQEEIVTLMVGPHNTKDDEFHPVNIQQKEEYRAFIEFLKEFMAEVNEYRHVTVTGKVGKPLKKK